MQAPFISSHKELFSLKDLLELFWLFFKFGGLTFGGGYAMIPVFQREFVTNRGWITDEDMLNYAAISQSTPGVIAVNMATFIGYRRRGFWGAVFATLGVVIPSIIIITIIAAFLSNFAENAYVKKALIGINISVAVILSCAVFDISKKSVKDIICLALAVCAFVAVTFFNVNSIFLIIFSLIVGLIAKGGAVLK